MKNRVVWPGPELSNEASGDLPSFKETDVIIVKLLLFKCVVAAQLNVLLLLN